MKHPIGDIKLGDHLCYLLFSQSSTRTYIGYTNNISRRIRAHNREIKHGARYTAAFGPWKLALLVSGFQTHQEALQFEYMAKHIRKRAHGRKMRAENFLMLIRKKKWTSNAPLAKTRPLTIHLFDAQSYISEKVLTRIPKYIKIKSYSL
jgi:predicted GIY-YIG superfamily endonuclease